MKPLLAFLIGREKQQKLLPCLQSARLLQNAIFLQQCIFEQHTPNAAKSFVCDGAKQAALCDDVLDEGREGFRLKTFPGRQVGNDA